MVMRPLGVRVGGSKSLSFCQCGHASFSSQILFLAVAPLSSLSPFWQNTVQLGMPLMVVYMILPGCKLPIINIIILYGVACFLFQSQSSF